MAEAASLPESTYFSSEISFLEPPNQVTYLPDAPDPTVPHVDKSKVILIDPDTLVEKIPLPETEAQRERRIREAEEKARQESLPHISSAEVRANARADSTGPGFVEGYFHYLTNPWDMDRDLELAFYTSLTVSAVATTAAGGLALAGGTAITVGQAATAATTMASRAGHMAWNAAQNPMVREVAKDLGKGLLREGVRQARDHAIDQTFAAATGQDVPVSGLLNVRQALRNRGAFDGKLYGSNPGNKDKGVAGNLKPGQTGNGPSSTERTPRPKNFVDGAAREKRVHEKLSEAFKEASVQRERTLRTADGRKAIDPLTGEGRRIDHAVIQDGKAKHLLETTSKTADKAAQTAKEIRIRENGGTFIRDKITGMLIDISDTLTKIIRVK